MQSFCELVLITVPEYLTYSLSNDAKFTLVHDFRVFSREGMVKQSSSWSRLRAAWRRGGGREGRWRKREGERGERMKRERDR